MPLPPGLVLTALQQKMHSCVALPLAPGVANPSYNQITRWRGSQHWNVSLSRPGQGNK